MPVKLVKRMIVQIAECNVSVLGRDRSFESLILIRFR
jgi:hypothetical protein